MSEKNMRRLEKLESAGGDDTYRIVADDLDAPFDLEKAKAAHERRLADMAPGDKVFSVLFGAWTKTRDGRLVSL